MNWQAWIKGLIAAIIGGAANAVTIMIVDPANFNFQDGGRKLATFAAVSALVSGALYLKQSPFPTVEPTPKIFEAKLIKREEEKK